MQQAAFDALGISARYELWDTPADQLAQRVASLRAPDILGANVTIPYKTAILPLLDDLAPDAAHRTGAVNTIVCEQLPTGIRLIGYNTDTVGLRIALHACGAALRGRRMLILGAGGAARAALAVARLEEAEIYVAARRITAAQALLAVSNADPSRLDTVTSHALALDDTPQLASALAYTAVLINATPIGTGDPNALPLPASLLAHLPPDAIVFDMVYNPPETALVCAARARGLRAAGGHSMLLYQGAAAFTLWTGQSAPLATMRAALGLTF
jgi:shikimate dehydrogenase